MAPKKSKEGLRKDGTSRRLRTGKGNKRGTPRIMILALLLVAAAALFLFWPKNGGVPAGIGEHRSVVTSAASMDSNGNNPLDNRPRSGEVDITHEEVKVVAEKPEGTAATTGKIPAKPAGTSVPKSVQKPAPKPAPKPAKKSAPKPDPQTPPMEKIQPRSEGRWAVQVGGFGKADNADKEAERLKELDWQAVVIAGSNNQGQMVYRVWIGYFQSRDEARLFLKQNQKSLPDAFVVHR
ncbi:hypothetical protein CSA17_03620 [bacterium DOLJORAL78_65_58]|nr:MAG: hypothetical protein CSB20_10935 [bacterium DOLZORAL124_64_63]PIE76168.1 MAG: hypothetical protein CSA17_03620 [bacterium DOLJORAL78_65_58]